jgi:molybdopterin converting factor small subunit
MRITIRLLASYRQYLPKDHDAQAGYPLDVPVGSTVSDVLRRVPVPQEEPYTYFVNGRHTESGQVLQAGDILSVFPAVGGG